MSLDAISLAVFKNLFASVAEDMGLPCSAPVSAQISRSAKITAVLFLIPKRG